MGAAVIFLCTPLMGAQAEPNCEQWNTEEFFQAAAVEDVTACLDAGADTEARDEDSRTPLHQAAWRGASPAVIEALLAARADLEARSDRGYTPLQQVTNGSYNKNLKLPHFCGQFTAFESSHI